MIGPLAACASAGLGKLALDHVEQLGLFDGLDDQVIDTGVEDGVGLVGQDVSRDLNRFCRRGEVLGAARSDSAWMRSSISARCSSPTHFV